MSLDIASVCGKSGYVHSAGHLIYARNMAKAEKEEFYKEMRYYLNANCRKPRKLFYVAYSHEDFTQYDRDKADVLRNGLDDVKIFVEKCFMDNERLVSIINQMRDVFKDRLEIPDSGDFSKKHIPALRGCNVMRDRTLWLIVDQSINESDFRHPGDEAFFICFEQRYINQNLFHIVDENKPAWIAHTTIPHTLAGAMISITTPYWPNDNRVLIADPFAGSGTIVLEARKFDRTRVFAGDNDPICAQLLKDNLEYLWPKKESIELIMQTLTQFMTTHDASQSEVLVSDNRWIRDIKRSTDLAADYDKTEKDGDKSRHLSIIDLVCKLSIQQRLAFYIGLRAIRRHAAALEREAENWLEAFQCEAAKMLKEYRRLMKLCEIEDVPGQSHGALAQGTYSLSCRINYSQAYNSKGKDMIVYKIKDARSADKRKYDVIITDPPYGINTQEDPIGLAEMYYSFAEAAIRSLKDYGQLVICLPEHTRTGQRVPYFVNRDIVIQQIIISAHRLRREVLSPSYAVPKLSALYRPPYYWDSERSLRRTILHFLIRKIQT